MRSAQCGRPVPVDARQDEVLVRAGDPPQLREDRVAARVGLARLGDHALGARVALQLHGPRNAGQGVIDRALVEVEEAAVVRVIEEDRSRPGQVERPPAIREVGRDDGAEREPK